ncbi:MAG TPA: DegT/DnrJ/EryC1/StrS aminotransferase family protein [Thermoanaerobaculia bacterium]|nr:DegT/DnrJ/EryC1/StrS aminotransferase family protein [Thermoanaerobaculia bacterium]
MELAVPFHRPQITDAEIAEVVSSLRSGWLTTGPKVRRFEAEFAEAVGARNAIALNSCTAALHLAVEAVGLARGEAVLVPTMTFAATAEVVRYRGAIPILVDVDPVTLHLDLRDAARKIDLFRRGALPPAVSRATRVAGIMPVHVGGVMMDISKVRRFAQERGLWVIEDAAHAFPAAWRPAPGEAWQRCGEDTADVTCFSFYANKTITTGEGGMAVTGDAALADRMRLMSLHGLSHDAWGRYTGNGAWDYRILAPGYKYNMTDLAAAIGVAQLPRAEEMRRAREDRARRYMERLRNVEEIELPGEDPDRLHAWHLFPVRLRLEALEIGRDEFLAGLRDEGVGTSVHWRPLHLHPYYEETFGWTRADFPAASRAWERLVSLPLYPDLDDESQDRVIGAIETLCRRHAAAAAGAAAAGS